MNHEDKNITIGQLFVVVIFTSIVILSQAIAEQRSSRIYTGTIQTRIFEDFRDEEENVRYEHTLRLRRSTQSYKLSAEFQIGHNFHPGTIVRVRASSRGVRRMLKPLRKQSLLSSVQVLSIPEFIPVQGEAKVLILAADFADKTLPCSNQDLQDIYFNFPNSVKEIVKKSSANQVSVTGKVVDRITLSLPSSAYNCENLESIGNEILKAATNRDPNLKLNDYSYVSFFFPGNCVVFAGAAEAPGRYNWNHECSSSRVAVHELGHNFGMYHATIDTSDQFSEYGDASDYMGSRASYLNAPHLEQMGWIGSNEYSELTDPLDTTVNLKPLWDGPATSSFSRFVKVNLTSAGRKKVYLSFRSNAAPFGLPLPIGYAFKVYVHEYEPGFNTTKLVAVLDSGEEYESLAEGYQVKIVSNTEIDAKVQFLTPCRARIPFVSIIKTQTPSNTAPGASFSYRADITNQDRLVCPSSNFTLSLSDNGSVTSSVFPRTVTLAPGVTTSVSFQIASPQGAADGISSFMLNAQNNSSLLRGSGVVDYIVSGSGKKSSLPQFQTESVVNSANYSRNSVGPGGLFSIFGSNLSDKICNASTLPLSNNLCGTKITMNGNVTVPILFTSPTQINAQLPFEIGDGKPYITVTTGAGVNRASLRYIRSGAGIFTQDSRGKISLDDPRLGLGIITDLSGNMITRDKPAKLGDTVIVYLTGSGQSAPASTAGVSIATARRTRLPFTASLLDLTTRTSVFGTIIYIGRTPGSAGLDQINFRIPFTGLEGLSNQDLLNLVLNVCPQSSPGEYLGECSNPVRIPVRR